MDARGGEGQAEALPSHLHHLVPGPAQVDVWAVGVLTFEVLVGFAPFENGCRNQTYSNIASREPCYPTWLSPEAISFIKIALVKASVCGG